MSSAQLRARGSPLWKQRAKEEAAKVVDDKSRFFAHGNGDGEAQKPKPRNPLQARWRITWMDKWNEDIVDAEVEGFFKFGPDGIGKFQFGYLKGDIDYRATTREAKPCIEFSWDGKDEKTAAQGRGFAVLDGDDLSGTIYIHRGHESDFTARKQKRR